MLKWKIGWAMASSPTASREPSPPGWLSEDVGAHHLAGRDWSDASLGDRLSILVKVSLEGGIARSDLHGEDDECH